MPKVIELKIKNLKNIYQELARHLAPHREEGLGSVLFVVEGTKQKPIIAISYPGKKLRKREETKKYKWANLYDFEVIVYKNGKQIDSKNFTFGKLFEDFYENKIKSEKFWKLIESVYNNNIISENIPELQGIDPKLYLLALKWIWIQEDFNYKFSWQDVDSPIQYILENKKGNPTAKGAGRGKFFAALILLRNKFSFKDAKKIIPPY